MIGLDTNVLVRYIVQDDEEQSRRAGELIEKSCTRDNPGFINRVVFCELVWVLAGAYRFDRSVIVNVLKQILITATFQVENSAIIWAAVNDYEQGNADLADYLLAHSNKDMNALPTITFDQKAGRHPLFQLI